jgi:uncharacterized protein YndB with AHSA1/START domain
VAGFSIGATIRRPIEEVFAALTDVEKTERWFPADVHEWWITPPPRGVGSVRRAAITTMGRRQENDATVIEYDPPRRGVLGGEQSGMTWTAALDFAPVDGGARVDVRFDIHAGGAMRLVLPPFLWWYRRSWEKGLVTFTRMMEAGEL